MGQSLAYIRSGLGQTTVSATKLFCLPIFQSLDIFDLNSKIQLQGSTEHGLISKDEFFLDLDCSFEFTTAFNKEIILQAHTQGQNRLEILSNSTLETLRTFVRQYNFKDISDMTDDLKSQLLSTLKEDGIEDLTILKFKIERTPLDNYDLENIVHFEKAKEIVTRIARVQIKDKEFIDKCRKTISHFDIVEE